MMNTSFKRKTLKGMAWTTIATVVRSIVSLLQVSILTKYLSKTDFGIVAIATLFIGLIQIFTDLGLSSGILHKKDITKKQYSSLFFLNVFAGVILTGLLLALAPLIANVYGQPELLPIISFLSFTILFSSIGSQHRTVQQKNFKFKSIAIIEILSSSIALGLAVFLVRNGFGVYSLVFSTIFNSICSNVFYFIIGVKEDKNLCLSFSLKETIPFLKIGVYSLGTQILDYFAREIDIVLISTFLGKEVLGLYSLCKKIVTMVYGAISPILNRVLTPLISELQEDVVYVRSVYYSLIKNVSLLSFPLFVLISVFSTCILNTLYGSEYLDGAIVLSILAIRYGILSVGGLVSSLQIALGRTDTGFYWTICRIILSAFFVYIGVQFNLMIVAVCLILMQLLSAPIAWRITVQPLIGGKFWEYFFISYRVLGLALLIALPIYMYAYQIMNLLAVIAISIIYAFTYLACIYIKYKDAYIVSLLRKLCRFILVRNE